MPEDIVSPCAIICPQAFSPLSQRFQHGSVVPGSWAERLVTEMAPKLRNFAPPARKTARNHLMSSPAPPARVGEVGEGGRSPAGTVTLARWGVIGESRVSGDSDREEEKVGDRERGRGTSDAVTGTLIFPWRVSRDTVLEAGGRSGQSRDQVQEEWEGR